MANKMSNEEYLEMVEEFKKDPQFMKALDYFIKKTTGSFRRKGN